MNWVIQRLKEPSTYLGIASIVAGMTFIPNAADWAALIAPTGVVIAGVLGIILKEKASS